jgi:hypothetical protein
MNAHNAAQRASAQDRAHYTTCARNKLYELRYARKSGRYALHVSASHVVHMLDIASAEVVYAAMLRHVVRTTKTVISMRSSLYILRSDIRSVLRAIEINKFAY